MYTHTWKHKQREKEKKTRYSDELNKTKLTRPGWKAKGGDESAQKPQGDSRTNQEQVSQFEDIGT